MIIYGFSLIVIFQYKRALLFGPQRFATGGAEPSYQYLFGQLCIEGHATCITSNARHHHQERQLRQG
jgi:hypothetical protein